MTAHDWRGGMSNGRIWEHCGSCGIMTVRRDVADPRLVVTSSGRAMDGACPETCEETAVLLAHLE